MSIASSFGMSLSFFLLIIYKYRSKANEAGKINNPIQVNKQDIKQDNKVSKKNTLQIEYVYNDQISEINYDKYKYILFTSIMDFILTVINYKYCFEIQINMWIFDILFLCLFSYLIIQMKIYRHHYISIILIILAGIGLNIIISLKYFHLIKTKIINIIIKFIHEIGCSLLYVIIKYTMEKKFCSPFGICFYQGFICLILYLLFLPINIFFDSDNLKEFISNFSVNDLFFIIFFIIIQFGYNIFFSLLFKIVLLVIL